MLDHASLKSLRLLKWMDGSAAPKAQHWLALEQSEEDKSRLKICGNIVIPWMAFFATHILKEMW